jgi:hypothetical protein
MDEADFWAKATKDKGKQNFCVITTVVVQVMNDRR